MDRPALRRAGGQSKYYNQLRQNQVEKESTCTAEDSDMGSSEHELEEDTQEKAWGRGSRGAEYLDQSTVHSRNTAERELRL